ncbi:hypothetical protein ACOME3_009568 [Neoechinorhynchus agilis]
MLNNNNNIKQNRVAIVLTQDSSLKIITNDQDFEEDDGYIVDTYLGIAATATRTPPYLPNRRRSDCELSSSSSSMEINTREHSSSERSKPNESSNQPPNASNSSAINSTYSKRSRRRRRQRQQNHGASSARAICPIIDQCVLNREQASKLRAILRQPIRLTLTRTRPIKCAFRLIELLKLLSEKLNGRYSSFKLNGGAASYVLCSSNHQNPIFNDIDMIIDGISKGNDGIKNEDWSAIMTSVRDSLYELAGSPSEIKNVPAKRLGCIGNFIRIRSVDSWALITLTPETSDEIDQEYPMEPWSKRKVELKFVNKMRRQFQFSVDSFQIEISRDTIERIWRSEQCSRPKDVSLFVKAKDDLPGASSLL